MPRDEDNKIFDVTRPSRVSPPNTSRPIIVSQRSKIDDPMVVGDTPKAPSHTPSPHSDVPPVPHSPVKKPISIFDGNAHNHPAAHVSPASTDIPSLADEPAKAPSHDAVAPHHSFEAHPSEPVAEPQIKPVEATPAHGPAGPYQPHFSNVDTLVNDSNHQEPAPGSYGHTNYGVSPDGDHQNSDAEELVGNAPFSTPSGAGPRRNWAKIFGIFLLVVLLIAAAGYFAVDGGLVKSDIKLPFHILNKQKTATAPAVTTSTTPTSSTPKTTTPAAPALPAGFTNYKLTDASLAFDYPTVWGDPRVTTDLGYTKRGGTIKSDGTHAFLVNFTVNKDVELAVTSAKYLPPVRGAMYYDYLQWCTGTNDSKFYKQVLHYSTTAGTDSPSTITCDTGPLADAAKLSTTDPDTIVQLKTLAADNTVLGDLYTKNLPKNPTVAVIRVKDAKMANSVAIKQLLGTTQDLAAPTSSSGSLPSSSSSSSSTTVTSP